MNARELAQFVIQGMRSEVRSQRLGHLQGHRAVYVYWFGRMKHLPRFGFFRSLEVLKILEEA